MPDAVMVQPTPMASRSSPSSSFRILLVAKGFQAADEPTFRTKCQKLRYTLSATASFNLPVSFLHDGLPAVYTAVPDGSDYWDVGLWGLPAPQQPAHQSPGWELPVASLFPVADNDGGSC
jgi:hypothetical protein